MTPIFDQVLVKLEEELTPEEFKRWFTPLKPILETEGQLTVQVPNIFFKNWISDKYLHRMNKIASELSGNRLEIDINIGPAGEDEASSTSQTAEVVEDQVRNQFDSRSHNLIEKYTFANFVVGSSNQLAPRRFQVRGQGHGHL